MSLPIHTKKKNSAIKVGAYLTKNQKSALLKFLDNKKSKDTHEFLYFTCQALLDDPSIQETSKESLKVFSEILLPKNTNHFTIKVKNSGRNSKISAEFMHEINCTFIALKLVQKNLTDFNNTIDYKKTLSQQKDQKHNKDFSVKITSLLKNIKHCIKALATDNPESRKKQRRKLGTEIMLQQSLETQFSTKTEQGSDYKIINMINAAICLDSSPEISGLDMESIKVCLGSDLFHFLAERYGILSKNDRGSLENKQFNYNDLRMIIIGSLQHCKTDWWDNDFIKNLLLCLKHNNLTDHNYRNNLERLIRQINNCPTSEKKQALVSQLVEKLKIPQQQLDKLKQIPAKGIINGALSYLREKLSDKWKFIIPINSKYNNHFARDFNTISSICDVNNWKAKKSNDYPTETIQRFASNEFLFHKLSTADCRNGSVIPIIEADGKKAFYKLHVLLNKPGLNGFALTPIDLEKTSEIKIIFKPKQSLALEIIDTENYIQQQEFERHKKELLENLNQVIADFKEKMPEHKRSSITLNIGGYGSGGTLAQCLMHEIIVNKANATLHNQTLNHEANAHTLQQTLTKTLGNNISAQHEHELKLGRKIKNFAKHQQSLQQNLLKEFTGCQEDSKAWLHKENQLQTINHFTLSTIKSGGVSKKMRNKFIQSLYLLHQNSQNNPSLRFSIKCDKLMSNGDPVQLTGGTDLATYVPKELMPTTLMSFSNIEDGYKSYKKYLLNITASSALIVIQYLISKTTLLPAWVSSLGTGLMLNTSANPGDQIADNLKSLLSKAKSSHEKFHLNKPIENCLILCNNHSNDIYDREKSLLEEKKMNKLINRKIPVFSSKPYQTIKKSIYERCRSLKERYLPAKNDTVVGFDRGNNPAQIFTRSINSLINTTSNPQPGLQATSQADALERLFKNASPS